ncbi:hypothetical protein C3V43_10515 [Bacteroides heparinolyticus]|uniref:hypothetical protein n=1 Tax=Prevotella heparinolytica TaxID=28113 RepID=UPI000D034283|nr:hypothetical protein [Bacteroides heparinolyticus]AVM58136.1 hypothetical protein C3V43_10515 [Bacteroides heparinolyticus]
MRKILFVVIPFILLYACDGNVNRVIETEAQKQVEVKAVDAPFSFDAVTNPTVWRTFQSLEEMQAACQIPDEILKGMSTDDLIQTCMSYPLYGNYLAYNNELDGIKTIMDHFNGFAELQKRQDAADKLIAYYEKIDVGNIAKKAMTRSSTTNNELSILHIGYLELILCSEAIPNLYSDSNISRLESVRDKRYEEKLLYPNIYSMHSIKKSLLLGAQIKLKSDVVDAKTKNFLSNYVKMGGEVESLEDYTKVSLIINNK